MELGCFEVRLGVIEMELGCFEARLHVIEMELGCFEVRLAVIEMELGCFEVRLGVIEMELGCFEVRLGVIQITEYKSGIRKFILEILLLCHSCFYDFKNNWKNGNKDNCKRNHFNMCFYPVNFSEKISRNC